MDIEEDKAKAEQYKNKGNQHFKNKEYKAAIEDYTNAIAYSQNEASYYGNRAACYLALENYQQCINDCNKALDIDPDFTKVLRRKALCQIQMLQFYEALLNIQKGLSIDQSDSNLKQDLAECQKLKQSYEKFTKYMDENNYDEAVNELNQLTQKISKNPQLLIKKVMCLAMKGSSDQAKQLLTQIQNYDGVKQDLPYLQGICEFYNGQTDKAKVHFRRGMEQDPDNRKCREALKMAQKLEELKEKGNDAIKSNKFDESIKIYGEALQIDPKNKKLNAIILSNRALAYVKKKDYKKALGDYFRAYLRRADIRMKMGDFESAVFDYQKVQELDPSQNVSSLLKEAQMQAKQAKKKDYYKILNVDRNATDKEITKSYRKLALKWHPDKNQDNKEEADKVFRDINEAYQVLSDPKKKQMFDQGVDPNDQGAGGPSGAGGMPADFDPNEIFKMFFGGAAGPAGAGGKKGGFSFGNAGGFSFGEGDDPFGGFTNGGSFGKGGNPFGANGNPFGASGNPFGKSGFPFGAAGGNQGFNFKFN